MTKIPKLLDLYTEDVSLTFITCAHSRDSNLGVHSFFQGKVLLYFEAEYHSCLKSILKKYMNLNIGIQTLEINYFFPGFSWKKIPASL